MENLGEDRAFIDQLADVWGSVVGLTQPLSPQSWSLATDCPGWSVKDQVSHMVGTESLLLGRSAPPRSGPQPGHVKNPIGEVNEDWVESMRGLAGEDVLARFEEVTRERLQALRSMSDAELEEPTPSPIGVVPYAEFMGVRVMDCWVHEQDIRHALGTAPRMDCDAAAVSLDRFASSLGFVVGKRVAPAEGTTVVVAVTGPRGRTRALAIRDGRAVPVAEPAKPTVRIEIEADEFARLAAGRAAPSPLSGTSRVSVTGDADLGRRVLEALPHIP